MAKVGAIISLLRETIVSSLMSIASNSKYCLLDFPNHPNVGDSAIWVGERKFLYDLYGSAPLLTCTVGAPIAELQTAIGENCVIFLHGGGNFGDIWPHHQRFRERVLRAFPRNKIVQMPQSIHFDTEAGILSARDAISSHPDFHLLVRDEESLTFAEERLGCRATLCPDLAFCMPAPARAPWSRDLLLLLRTDKEVSRPDDGALTGLPVEDWLYEPPLRLKAAKLAYRAAALARSPRDRNRALVAYYDMLAAQRVRRGLAQLASARVIVTDRLHAHILSLLLGRPHAVLDNSYGKIERFDRAFGIELAGCQRFTQLDEAVAWAKSTPLTHVDGP